MSKDGALVPVPERPVPPTGPLAGFRVIGRALRSLLKGLRVTLKTLVGETVTERYPHTQPELSERYRSAIELVYFDDLETHNCIACNACDAICPSACLVVEGEKLAGSKKGRATKFTLDYSTCSLCGLCIAVCPEDTLKYSRRYDDATFERTPLQDLLEPFTDPAPELLLERVLARDEARKAARKAARDADKGKKAGPKAGGEAADG